MKGLRVITFGFSLMLIPIIDSSHLWAQSQSDQKAVEKHQKLFSSINHLKVDFKQTIYKKLRDRKIVRTGQAFFSKPSKFRWNFNEKQPENEEFYFDGQTLTHYKADEKLVTHYKANIGLARELREVVNLVLDPKALFDRYSILSTTTKGQNTTIVMTPRPAIATDIQKIKVTVSDRNRDVREVTILYMDGNYTEFLFSNPITKANDPKIFRFSKTGDFTVRSHG